MKTISINNEVYRIADKLFYQLKKYKYPYSDEYYNLLENIVEKSNIVLKLDYRFINE